MKRARGYRYDAGRLRGRRLECGVALVDARGGCVYSVTLYCPVLDLPPHRTPAPPQQLLQRRDGGEQAGDRRDLP